MDIDELEKKLADIEKQKVDDYQEQAWFAEMSRYKGDDEIISFEEALKLTKPEKTGFYVQTGFPSIDKLLPQNRENDLIIISGDPGSGKCFGKGTKILLYNGTIKNVEDIVVGDVLMGDDGTPRNVLSLASGNDEMFEVELAYGGGKFICNKEHILVLKRFNALDNKRGKQRNGEIIEIPIKEYVKIKSGQFQKKYQQFKVGVDFPEKKLLIDPYFIGLWLGDGTSANSNIATPDQPIIDWLKQYSKINGYNFRQEKENSKAFRIRITSKRGSKKSLRSKLRSLGLLKNKHIPNDYLINSTSNRLSLLAGLLDSDGYRSRGGIDITNKSKELADQIVFLARSLGFHASIREKYNKKYQKNYYIVSIRGDVEKIPLLLKRKLPVDRRKNRDHSRYKFTVKPLGMGKYHGFVIDGNQRFLLGDFTVSHNTTLAMSITANLSQYYDVPSLWFTMEVGMDDFLKKFGTRLPKGFMPKSIVDRSIVWIERKIVESLAKFKTRVVFIDNLNALNEYYNDTKNLSAGVGRLAMHIKKIALKYHIIIYLMVHSSKAKDGQTVNWKDIRDSQLIANACDTIIMVWRVEKNQKGWKSREEGLQYTEFTMAGVQKNRRFGNLGNCKMTIKNGLFYEVMSIPDNPSLNDYDDDSKNNV